MLAEVQRIGQLADLYYVRQKEPLGLGHAVYCARQFIGNEPFAVLLGDDLVRGTTPCLKQLLDLYEKVQSTVIAVMEVPPEHVNRYGILDAVEESQGVYRVKDLVEKPPLESAPSRLAIMGRYIMNRAFSHPGRNRTRRGEIQLDALRQLCREQAIYGLAFQEALRCGDKLGPSTVEFAWTGWTLPGIRGVPALCCQELFKGSFKVTLPEFKCFPWGRSFEGYGHREAGLSAPTL